MGRKSIVVKSVFLWVNRINSSLPDAALALPSEVGLVAAGRIAAAKHGATGSTAQVVRPESQEACWGSEVEAVE